MLYLYKTAASNLIPILNVSRLYCVSSQAYGSRKARAPCLKGLRIQDSSVLREGRECLVKARSTVRVRGPFIIKVAQSEPVSVAWAIIPR